MTQTFYLASSTLVPLLMFGANKFLSKNLASTAFRVCCLGSLIVYLVATFAITVDRMSNASFVKCEEVIVQLSSDFLTTHCQTKNLYSVLSAFEPNSTALYPGVNMKASPDSTEALHHSIYAYAIHM